MQPTAMQAGTLHSGSISFGRFEVESLSWERRSSFSHNKYLEEDPKKLMAKQSPENRSENRRTNKSGNIAQPFESNEGENKPCQTANRPMRTVCSSKSDMKPNGAVFNFKSNERAEKRKEFYMKLDEKINAKDVEMNQIQARTQGQSSKLHNKENRLGPIPTWVMGTFSNGVATEGTFEDVNFNSNVLGGTKLILTLQDFIYSRFCDTIKGALTS